VTPTSSSDPSASSLTKSTSATAPLTMSQAKSSPTGHSTLSTPPSKETASSSSSTASISPTAGLSSNKAIPLIQNPCGMIAGALVSIFTILFL
jgi:hypothetical protein